jgi:hypothetical protein
MKLDFYRLVNMFGLCFTFTPRRPRLIRDSAAFYLKFEFKEILMRINVA